MKTDVGTPILPGGNNQHTGRRRIDPLQRDFNGHRAPSALEALEEQIEDEKLASTTGYHLRSGGKVSKEGYLEDGFISGDTEPDTPGEASDEEWQDGEDSETEGEESEWEGSGSDSEYEPEETDEEADEETDEGPEASQNGGASSIGGAAAEESDDEVVMPPKGKSKRSIRIVDYSSSDDEDEDVTESETKAREATRPPPVDLTEASELPLGPGWEIKVSGPASFQAQLKLTIEIVPGKTD